MTGCSVGCSANEFGIWQTPSERLQSAAKEVEEFGEKVDAEDQEQNDKYDREDGVCGREPGEPDGKKVFADAERPIRKRFGDGVSGGARAGFGAVCCEGDSSSEERGEPAPFRGDACGDAERENGRGRRSDEGVEKIPDRVEVGDFIGEEFEDVEADGETEHDGMREDVEFIGEMDDVEAFEKAESGDGSVEIEARREAGAEGERDGLEGVHRVSGLV